MKALSVRAPWWWWILYGGKIIENRSRPTKLRGFILIHASKWWKEGDVYADDREALSMALRERKFKNTFEASQFTKEMLGTGIPRADILRPRAGHIVGVAEICGCVEQDPSPWFVGEYGYRLQNVIALKKPYPYPGKLGFFWASVSSEVVRIFCRHVQSGLLTEGQAVQALASPTCAIDRIEIRRIIDVELGGMPA